MPPHPPLHSEFDPHGGPGTKVNILVGSCNYDTYFRHWTLYEADMVYTFPKEKREGKCAILSTGFSPNTDQKVFCYSWVSNSLDVHVHTTVLFLPSNVHSHIHMYMNAAVIECYYTGVTYLSSEVAVLIEAGLFWEKTQFNRLHVSLDPPNLLMNIHMYIGRNLIHMLYHTCFPHIPMSFGAIWTSVVTE